MFDLNAKYLGHCVRINRFPNSDVYPSKCFYENGRYFGGRVLHKDAGGGAVTCMFSEEDVFMVDGKHLIESEKVVNKIICLDYDGTYTDFPELCNSIIRQGKNLGYDVILATMRTPEEEDSGLRMLSDTIRVIYTSRQAKQPYLENLGIYPDVWIDDQPKWILHNA